jgi:hypothetical protein
VAGKRLGRTGPAGVAGVRQLPDHQPDLVFPRRAPLSHPDRLAQGPRPPAHAHLVLRRLHR